MNALLSRTGMALGLLVALVVVSVAQAQTHSATTLPAPGAPSAPTPQAEGPDALFARWDTNHDKLLSPAEFRAGWQALEAQAELRRLHEQFVAMDTNKNGCLNAAEYAHLELIKHAGASAPPMAMFDTQKNQCLDFKEYVGVVDYMLKQKHQ